MAATPSTMLALGTPAPDFDLPNLNAASGPLGGRVRLADLRAGGKPLLVMFLCNHCPFVKHLRAKLAEVCRDAQQRGVAVVAISSNDVEKYPDDSPAKMTAEAAEAGYVFPYLYDESQDVAKRYRAACTPDLFLFDRAGQLVYRGQFDDSRPKNGLPVTGADLKGAIEAVLAGRAVPERQIPSIGCNIKWKLGNEPDYAKSA